MAVLVPVVGCVGCRLNLLAIVLISMWSSLVAESCSEYNCGLAGEDKSPSKPSLSCNINSSDISVSLSLFDHSLSSLYIECSGSGSSSSTEYNSCGIIVSEDRWQTVIKESEIFSVSRNSSSNLNCTLFGCYIFRFNPYPLMNSTCYFQVETVDTPSPTSTIVTTPTSTIVTTPTSSIVTSPTSSSVTTPTSSSVTTTTPTTASVSTSTPTAVSGGDTRATTSSGGDGENPTQLLLSEVLKYLVPVLIIVLFSAIIIITCCCCVLIVKYHLITICMHTARKHYDIGIGDDYNPTFDLFTTNLSLSESVPSVCQCLSERELMENSLPLHQTSVLIESKQDDTGEEDVFEDSSSGSCVMSPQESSNFVRRVFLDRERTLSSENGYCGSDPKLSDGDTAPTPSQEGNGLERYSKCKAPDKNEQCVEREERDAKEERTVVKCDSDAMIPNPNPAAAADDDDYDDNTDFPEGYIQCNMTQPEEDNMLHLYFCNIGAGDGGGGGGDSDGNDDKVVAMEYVDSDHERDYILSSSHESYIYPYI